MTCNTFPEKRPKRFRLLFASVLYSKVGNECKKYKCIQEWVEGQNFDSMQQAYVVVGLCLAELLTIISPFLSRIVVEKHVGYYCANTVFLFAYFIASLKVFHCVELTPFTTPLSYRIHLVNCNIWTVAGIVFTSNSSHIQKHPATSSFWANRALFDGSSS